MTKNIIFIFAVLCSLQVRANVQPSERDTVRNFSVYNVGEQLRSMQPLYLDGVIVPASRSGNWFVSIAGERPPFSAHRSVVKTCSDG